MMMIAFITIKSSLVPLIEGLGKAPSHIIVHQAVPVTRVKWDTLLAMHIQAEPSTTSLAADTDQLTERIET